MRFHLRIALLDAGASRAVLIPLTRNHAGFPDGISGVDLLVRVRAQAVNFSTVITHAHADVLSRTPEGFAAQNPKRDDRGEKRSHRHRRRQSPPTPRE
jgi:thioredoxin reductase (NADPH)